MTANYPIRIGTIGGTLLSTLWNISIHDVLHTMVLAAVGAATGFTVTLILQRITKKRK